MGKSIMLKLTGGLGNQLFKVLAGIKISNAARVGLSVDTSWYQIFNDTSGKVQSRNLELPYFPELSKLNYVTLRYPHLDLRKNQLMKRLPIWARNSCGYFTDSNVDLIIDSSKIRILDGNFERNDLLPTDSDLQSLLRFPKLKSNWFKINEKNVNADTIAVHIRMGDYQNLSNIYGFLTPDYYLKALSILRKTSEIKHIVLFSDDPNAALNWMCGKIQFDLVINSMHSVGSGDILQLMSKSGKLIIAHSTFSWWAAKLGVLNGTCKEVVMPSRFLKDETHVNFRLKEKDWHVVDV